MSQLQGPPRPQKTGNAQADEYLNRLYQWAYQLWFFQTAVGSITQAYSALTFDIGNADTTLSRAAAGVVAVEGVNILTTATGAALAGSTTQLFNVEAATAADHAVSRVFGDARYAALAGLSTQVFSIAAATAAAHAVRLDQIIVSDSGIYTPTLTNVANLDSSTAYQCQYLRVGSVVTVSGAVAVDPTLAATSTQLGISLPIASNIGVSQDCCGTAFASGVAGQGAAILGDVANDRAQLQFISADLTNQVMYFTFQYRII